jgi:hypothetical protein
MQAFERGNHYRRRIEKSTLIKISSFYFLPYLNNEHHTKSILKKSIILLALKPQQKNL